MSDAAERTVDTELDYVASDDPNAFYIKVVDAVTGEAIEGVTEANAVDGWFYQERRGNNGQIVTERYINDRGLVDVRYVRFRVEKPIAIVFTAEAPGNLRGQEFRLKAK